MKAILRYAHKLRIQDRYVVELVIHEVPQTSRQPIGLKYRLVCTDLKSGSRVLMDNHHPKGPHIHIDGQEGPYEFVNEDKLISDFKEIVLERMRIKL
jgi:pyruvate kinase